MFGKLKNRIHQLKEDTKPLEFEPISLNKAYDIVRSKYEDGELALGISLSDVIKKIEDRVIDGDEEVINVLENRELKYVPYIAYAGNPPCLTKDSFFNYCASQVSETNKSTIISGWLHNYLKHRGLDSLNNKHLGKLLERRINTYSGPSRRIQFWKNNIDKIINSEKSVAKNLLHESKSFDQFIEEYRLSTELNESDFANEVVKRMIKLCKGKFPRFLPQVLEELKYSTKDGSTYYRDKEIVRYAASNLLQVAGLDCDEKVKNQLKKPFIKILKDPRIKTNINWEGVSPKSVDTMKQWLSARDIEFFFEIVSKTEEKYSLNTHWEYRKAFWMAYLPYIEDTWVAMGSTARDFAKLVINRKDVNYSDFGKLSGAESIQSVFFLRIKGVDVVEYSHSGASRVWRIEDSPLDFRAKSVHVDKFRKRGIAPPHLRKFEHRSSERYRWQSKLSGWLQRELDIEPKQSYRIN